MRKNIFFDYGRTIVEHPEDGVGLKIVKKAGAASKEDAELIRNEIFSVTKYANFLDEGSMERDEFKRLFLQKIPEKLHRIAIKAADYHISELPVIDGMEQLFKKLKKDGYKLYITSNMDAFHAKQMYETEIMKYFDGAIFSAEIKIRKPHKGFFDAACERFGVKPEECIFIDDLEENVEGAAVCGIKGFVFKGDPSEAEAFICNENRGKGM